MTTPAQFPNLSPHPRGLQLIATARTIRWFGWGFIEPLIPVVLLSFSTSFAEAGLFRSVYDVVFLLSLPTVSLLADRISSRTILLLGLLLYPLLGVSYVVAGLTGAALFIVIARALNGAAYCCDLVGTTTYIRRHSPQETVATSFGYLDTLTHASWLGGALLSLLLVTQLPLYFLFLAVSITSIIALFFIRNLDNDQEGAFFKELKKVYAQGVFWHLSKEIAQWSQQLRLLGGLLLVLGGVEVAGSFFVPLIAYNEGASLQAVILISVVLNTPWLFAYHFGKLADIYGNQRLLCFGLLGYAVAFSILMVNHSTATYLLISIPLGIVSVLVRTACRGLITTASDPKSYGAVTGITEGLDNIGELVSPLLIGLVVDYLNESYVFALLTLVTFGMYLLMKHRPDSSAFYDP